MCEANNCLYLVAVVRERNVGILRLEGSSRPSMRHVAELDVSVMKDNWLQGIWRWLIGTALGWAGSSPVPHKVFLIVHHENQRAVDLYLKLRFTQEGVLSKLLYVEGKYHDCLYLARAV